MTRPRPDKTLATNTTSKSKPGPRKRDKTDLCGWFIEDGTDDTDIGPWMSRRVEGETRKGHHRKHKDKSDPRSAPPFNKFLWASKSTCKAIENLAQFAQESLHEYFLGKVQVRLKQVNGGIANGNNAKAQGQSSASASDTARLTKSEPNVSSNDNVTTGASQRCHSAKVTGSGGGPVASVQQCRETEVTRLKRLIAIARRYRQEASENGKQLQGTEVDNPYSSYISISSEVSDATGDSGVSLSSLKSHLAEVDGIWALEYINNESENSNVDGDSALPNDQPVKFSYTQGSKVCGQTTKSPEKIVTILCGNEFSENSPPTKESTPFITTLRNYKTNQEDVEAIRPLVRSLQSARGKARAMNPKNSFLKSSPGQSENSDGSGSNKSKADTGMNNGDTVSAKSLSTGEATVRPTSAASFKVQRINIIIPNKNPDQSVSQDLDTFLPASHPANVIFKKLREKGINATSSVEDEEFTQTEPNIRVSSAVFPIGDILPVVDANYQKAISYKKYQNFNGELYNSSTDSLVSDSVNITPNDLLMHRGNKNGMFTGEKYIVVKHPERLLGPPPFRPMTNKTPLHRARDTSQKRIYGNSFAQETQDLYQKLILAKNGVVDNRQDLASGRRRPEARHL